MAKAIPEFEKIFRYRILGFCYSPPRRLYVLVRFFPGESIHGGFCLPAERAQPAPPRTYAVWYVPRRHEGQVNILEH
jgi:hypothetical protein